MEVYLQIFNEFVNQLTDDELLGLHVCTVHQQYQSTFYCSSMMHTIIKSQEY
jgi:hypothetical protein